MEAEKPNTTTSELIAHTTRFKSALPRTEMVIPPPPKPHHLPPHVIRQDDPRLVAIKAELLHGLPELTGTQINSAALIAVMAISRLSGKEQI